GWEVAIVDAEDRVLPPGELGEIAVKRRGAWFRVKDRGRMDLDGYIHHAGRSDDVIISAGWTMSALEIERALQSHPDVVGSAVISSRVTLCMRATISRIRCAAARAFARRARVAGSVVRPISMSRWPTITASGLLISCAAALASAATELSAATRRSDSSACF